MELSTKEIKMLETEKQPIRCKLVVEVKMTASKFIYTQVILFTHSVTFILHSFIYKLYYTFTFK